MPWFLATLFTPWPQNSLEVHLEALGLTLDTTPQLEAGSLLSLCLPFAEHFEGKLGRSVKDV